jgi:phosphoribosylaminoimidazole-succinocarboxamide synthase
VYEAGQDQLVMVASDRLSAFDVVLPTPIPDKGRVLTQLSNFWFGRTAKIVPNHLLETELDRFPAPFAKHPELAGRSVLVKRAERIDYECVARGYLAGSGWAEYRKSGTVAGERLPPGLQESARLDDPIFTPATKAITGHDENISRAQLAGALRSLGVDVDSVRTGKEIVVRFSADDLPEASAKARQMGDELLANPVIEEFAVEVAAE